MKFDRDSEVFYKEATGNILILAFTLTWKNQLSPSTLVAPPFLSRKELHLVIFPFSSLWALHKVLIKEITKRDLPEIGKSQLVNIETLYAVPMQFPWKHTDTARTPAVFEPQAHLLFADSAFQVLPAFQFQHILRPFSNHGHHKALTEVQSPLISSGLFNSA